MAIVVLVALLASGLAHASRLCGMGRHAAAATSADVRCPAHRAAASAAAADTTRPVGPTSREAAPHEREPACCARGESLATLPGGRVEVDRNGTVLALAPARVGETQLLAADAGGSRAVAVARVASSGPRLHLVHRILLI